MPTDFEDLAEAQRRTSRALQELLLQLRRTSSLGAVSRVPQPLSAGREGPPASGSERVIAPLPARRERRQLEALLASAPSRLSQIQRASSPVEVKLVSRAPTVAGGEREPASKSERVIAPLPVRRQEDQLGILLANVPRRQNLSGTATGEDAAAGVIRRGQESVTRALNETTNAVRDLGSGLDSNTRALTQSAAALAGGQGLFAGLLGSLGQRGGSGGLLGSGFGLLPLGLKVAGLFRDRRNEPLSFSPFELPPSLALEVANTDNILAGFPRVARKGKEIKLVPTGNAAVQPLVQVNVNAMDTQSFLDRSQEIAGALRDAMLHMHPVNDVINEV